jgi:ABC-2 type transport system ATP-binding protein
MQQPIIAFDHISKSFGKKKVITQLTLSIRAREIFGIIGRSGAGKSTLLKMLIGFYPVDSGNILYKGKNITNKTAIIKQVVGFCPQENSFYPELTVLENVWYYGKLYGLSRDEMKKRQQELLKLVDIYGSRHILAGNLSGGMKRRLDFAISLIHHPQLLILDEPTTGLDPITEKQIWDLIKGLSHRGVSIIVISHMLAFVEKYCDTVGFLDAGEIVLQSSPAVLRKKYGVHKTFAEIFEKVLVRNG